jgi:hypothetical protein
MLCAGFQGGNNELLLRMITRAVDKELFDRRIMMIHVSHYDAIVTNTISIIIRSFITLGSHILQPLTPSLQ